MTFTPAQSGYVPFAYQGQSFKTFFKLFGDLSTATRPPLIVLHGGPGLTHDYLLPISDLQALGIPVILYDQLGNGLSTHLRDIPELHEKTEQGKKFFGFDIFMDELENLLDFFNIASRFDLLGHSWGGVLASEWEVSRKPVGLRRLILTNTLAAGSLWGQATGQLVSQFPDDVKQAFGVYLADKERFRGAMAKFIPKHICRVDPVPAEVMHSLDQCVSVDGDSDVATSGFMNGWTIIDRLDRVRVPTFVINGRHEQAKDFVVYPFFEHIPKVKWVTMDGSHMPFWEERERYMTLLADFLQVEGRSVSSI